MKATNIGTAEPTGTVRGIARRPIWYGLGLCFAAAVLFIPIFLPPALHATTVTLNGVNYTLVAHPRVWLDGPNGPLTASLQNTAGKANSNNPAFAGLAARVNGFLSSNICSTGPNKYSGYLCPGANAQANIYNMSQAVNAAILWYSQGADPADRNGYLAAAKYGYNHFEDFASGSFACDESQNYCGSRFVDVFADLVYDYVWTGFSLIRSQMTAAEIGAFAGKILNDNGSEHNGINPVGSGCTKQPITAGTGAITTVGNVVTGSGTRFTSALKVGSVIFQATADGGSVIGTVYSINSDTQAILTTAANYPAPSGAWRYAAPWASGNCGAVWFMKHHQSTPPLIPGQQGNYATDYPVNAGMSAGYDNNISIGAIRAYIEAGLALADDDSRAGALLAQAYDWYYAGGYTLYSQNGMYPLLKMGTTSFAQGGAYYTPGAWQAIPSEIAIAVRNSTVSGPDLTPGNYIGYAPAYTFMNALPGAAATFDNWGDVYAPANQLFSQGLGALVACAAQSANSYCPGFYNWLRNGRGDYNQNAWAVNSGMFLPWYYIFNDVTATAAAPTALQFAFKTPDLTYSQCVLQFPSSTCIPGETWQAIISKSDWGPAASQVLIQAGWYSQGQDHTGGYQEGAYHIFRNGKYLLGGDAQYANSIATGANTLQLGSASNWNAGAGYAPVSRWAGADPTGPANNNYAYAMVDLGPSFNGTANATRASRHIAHLKQASSQDYIVTYDDVAVSGGEAIAAYWHYFLNGGSSSAVAFSAQARTVANSQGTSLVNSVFLPVTGSHGLALVLDSTDGTYPGGQGFTFRVTSCASTDGSTCSASATSFEELVIHQPCGSANCRMPAVTQPSCSGTGGSCTAAQIADSGSPKVIAFARGGALLTGLSLTTTHSGTGQYLLAGIAPGIYNLAVTANGSEVFSSQVSVAANDDTLEFQSPAGALQLVRSGLERKRAVPKP